MEQDNRKENGVNKSKETKNLVGFFDLLLRIDERINPDVNKTKSGKLKKI